MKEKAKQNDKKNDSHNSNDSTYSEKDRLNKIGVGTYDYHHLPDLEQILRCENWAKNNISGRIKKIILFTPNFNDSKPDASNYSCAIVIDENDNNWAIVYRPSYVANIENDLVIKKFSNNSEAERKLNGDRPISALESSYQN